MRNSYARLSGQRWTVNAAGKRVSLRPSDAVQGGVIDDVDVEFTNSRFEVFDFNGKGKPRVCLTVDFKTEGVEEPQTQYLSAANPEHFAPSDDGQFIESISDKGALVKGTGYIALMDSLIKLGLPEPTLDNGAGALDGLKCHIVRVPAPKLRGIVQEEGQKDPMHLVATEIHELPGGKKGAKKGAVTKPAAGAKKPVAKAKEVEEEAGELSESDLELAMVVQGIVAEQGALKKTKLVTHVFKAVDPAARTKSTQRVVKDDFLMAAAAAGLIAFDGDEISAAE